MCHLAHVSASWRDVRYSLGKFQSGNTRVFVCAWKLSEHRTTRIHAACPLAPFIFPFQSTSPLPPLSSALNLVATWFTPAEALQNFSRGLECASQRSSMMARPSTSLNKRRNHGRSRRRRRKKNTLLPIFWLIRHDQDAPYIYIYIYHPLRNRISLTRYKKNHGVERHTWNSFEGSEIRYDRGGGEFNLDETWVSSAGRSDPIGGAKEAIFPRQITRKFVDQFSAD